MLPRHLERTQQIDEMLPKCRAGCLAPHAQRRLIWLSLQTIRRLLVDLPIQAAVVAFGLARSAPERPRDRRSVQDKPVWGKPVSPSFGDADPGWQPAHRA